MRFFFYAPYKDEQQLSAIQEYRFPYNKDIVGVTVKDLGQAKEGDVIAIFGHGMEAQESNLNDPDVRSMHNYVMWGSEHNPFNEMGPPLPFAVLPRILKKKLNLKPAKYTFFFCVCFAGQVSVTQERNPFLAVQGTKNRAPNIEVFANALTDEDRGFAESTAFGPTGPILRPLTFFARYQTLSHDTWVGSGRNLDRIVPSQVQEVPFVRTQEVPGLMTVRTSPQPAPPMKISMAEFFPGGFHPKVTNPQPAPPMNISMAEFFPGGFFVPKGKDGES